MRLQEWLAAGLLIVAPAGCRPGGTGTSPLAAVEQDRTAIDKTRNEYVSKWKAGSADQMATLYTDDAVVLYPNQPPVKGRAAIGAYFKSFFDQFAQEAFELTSEEIEIAGPWAFDRGSYHWKGILRTGGAPVEDTGKYLVILRRQADGTWKVARDMDNSDRPRSQATRGAG